MKSPKKSPRPSSCSICRETTQQLTACEGGFVCEPCCQQILRGRDNTSKAVRATQRSMRDQALKVRATFNGGLVDEMLEYSIASSTLLAADALENTSVPALVPGGEVLPQHDLKLVDTLGAPGVVALDASANRLDLISRMGTDVSAMALDASDTIQASNSLEKMLSHQLAVLHVKAMQAADQSTLERDPVHAARLLNLSIRSMEIFQKGLLTLKRLRSTGEQRITIERVNVTDGGQAVIGALQTGGVLAK